MGESANHDPTSRTPSLVRDVAEACRRRGARLAVAESCTGGLVAAALTALAGSSEFFLGGAVTYANSEKTRALGVPEELLRRHGAVSEEVARAMAEGIRVRTGASHAVAITGIAGPGGGSPDKPVGTVWMALATAVRVDVERHRFTGDRAAIRASSVEAALALFLRGLAS